jgi:hypothetical protein
LDGALVESLPSSAAPIANIPMYLILDTYLNGWGSNTIDASTPFPMTVGVTK